MNNDSMPRSFPLHIDALITVTKTSFSDREVDEIMRTVNTRQAWSQVIQAAYRHAVIPQLYKAAKTLSDRVPDDSLRFLQKHYQHIAKENIQLTAQLIHIVTAFDAHEVKYVALKGPSLAQELYEDITLRQICDLDLLVDIADLQRAASLLIELGFESKLPLSLLENSGFLALDNDFVFMHHQKKVMVELHWELFPKRHKMPLAFTTLSESSKKVLIHKKAVTVLSTEHNLLYLSLHGSKHIFEELKWLIDIDRLIRRHPELDFEKVYHYAQALDVTEPFLLGLLLSRHLYETPLSEHIMSLSTPTTAALMEKAMRYLSSDFNTLDEPIKKRERFLFLNLMNQDKQNRLNGLLLSVFTPSSVDYIHYNLPSRYNFLYPLLRPPRLFYKYLIKKILP